MGAFRYVLLLGFLSMVSFTGSAQDDDMDIKAVQETLARQEEKFIRLQAQDIQKSSNQARMQSLRD